MGTTHRPELWLTSSDLALSCSEFEGMPLGPIEAAGAGLPMVLSEIPGHAVVKDASLQFPLGDHSEGARLVETGAARARGRSGTITSDGPGKRAAEVRSTYTLGCMSAAYSGLYIPWRCARHEAESLGWQEIGNPAFRLSVWRAASS